MNPQQPCAVFLVEWSGNPFARKLVLIGHMIGLFVLSSTKSPSLFQVLAQSGQFYTRFSDFLIFQLEALERRSGPTAAGCFAAGSGPRHARRFGKLSWHMAHMALSATRHCPLFWQISNMQQSKIIQICTCIYWNANLGWGSLKVR